jgi:O-acetyl-ADP-ribose deacetylase
VAVPAVSAGVYGWDVEDVARIAVGAVQEAPERAGLELVRFVLFGPAAHQAFTRALGGP